MYITPLIQKKREEIKLYTFNKSLSQESLYL